MFSRPKILFLVSLLFVALLNPKFNPYLLFKFKFFIILVYTVVADFFSGVIIQADNFVDDANYWDIMTTIMLSIS